MRALGCIVAFSLLLIISVAAGAFLRHGFAAAWAFPAIVISVFALVFLGMLSSSRRRRANELVNSEDDARVVRGGALDASLVENSGGDDNRKSSPRLNGAVAIGGCEIDRADESKHFLFAGATGSGKSQGIYQILQAVRQRQKRCIVADSGGRTLERFYRPGDLILNPFDKRSEAWSPFPEISAPSFDCSRIAKAAIPEGEGEAREWHIYAQVLLAETMKQMHQIGQCSTEDLMTKLTADSAGELAVLLKGTPAHMLCQPGSEKMLANTRAILSAHLVAWQHLAQAGTFSIREWVRNQSSDAWLFITYREDQFALLRSLTAMLLDLAVVEVLSLEEDEDREIWFILDEVDSLAKVSSLRHALTKLRKYGGKCVLGLQTVAQLRSTYGDHEAQTLMANIANKLILRAGDGETAEYFSQEFGNQEVQRTQRGLSSTSGASSSVTDSANLVQTTRRVVLDSEISGLPDLEGFLKTPASLKKVRLAYQNLPKVTDAFIRSVA